MEHDFWHKKWSEGKIGFHQGDINPYLRSFWERLGLSGEGRVFVPLCGKSMDMLWLREQGHEVVGIELSEPACEAFFHENDIQPEISTVGGYSRRYVDGIELLCGDFFKLQELNVEGVTAVYDRAALVALPELMRKQYVQHLIEILPKGIRMLLVTLEFEGDQGPPFSVTSDEVLALYSGAFEIECLDRVQPDDPRDVGRTEIVWLLKDKRA